MCQFVHFLSCLSLCCAHPCCCVQAAKLDRWAVGKTKLFLKFYHLHTMESRLEKFYLDVVRTQSAIRRKSAWRILIELQRRQKLELNERLALEKR